MVDLLRFFRDRRVVVQKGGRWELLESVAEIEDEIPESVRSMVQKKIEQLTDDDRRLLTAASVQGYEFEAVVIAREDVPGDQRLVAYVIPKQGRSVDEAGLREHLRSRLPEWMRPAHVVGLTQFPQTPNRKVDRKALPAPQSVQVRKKDYVAPESDLEGRIADIWTTVLHVPGKQPTSLLSERH